MEDKLQDKIERCSTLEKKVAELEKKLRDVDSKSSDDVSKLKAAHEKAMNELVSRQAPYWKLNVLIYSAIITRTESEACKMN